MRTPEEERYVHLQFCSDDLNSAWWLLGEIKRQGDNPLVGAAFQYAVIAYARPFKTSYGALEPRTKLRLDPSHVPERYRGLHDRLLTTRDRIIAHRDVGVWNPKLSVFEAHSGRNQAALVYNVIHGTEELPNVDAIIEAIEATLDSVYSELELRKSNLPLSSHRADPGMLS
ncbi:hypothetical protein [Rubrivirga sp.]|uniref:hypothetical protein n=1 Tax=Rubrivirga sp. TaxID=1885344 RepID=UPI003C70A061